MLLPKRPIPNLNTVKKWIGEQSLDIKELDAQALTYGNEALAFRTMLKFIESENVIKNLKEKVILTLINPVYKETGRLQKKRPASPRGEFPSYQN